ncbi:MAG: hypothetical protein JEZ14_03895 [Marinilabiliaceae bacterium]|nr:hypothetical protein [Marinilabiliaceae bacterium]
MKLKCKILANLIRLFAIFNIYDQKANVTENSNPIKEWCYLGKSTTIIGMFAIRKANELKEKLEIIKSGSLH